MKQFFKSYKASIILLASVIIGGIIGAVIGPRASVLEPLGKLFLNFMFTLIVPLVFFSVSSAVSNMGEMKRFWKIIGSVVIVFVATSLIASIVGLTGAFAFNPVKGMDIDIVKRLISQTVETSKDVQNTGFLQQIVNTVTVGDFSDLFTRKNMLQIIVFALIFGISTASLGEKAEPVAKFLNAGTKVMMKMVNIIMYYAPIGLGAYFASVVGQLGPQIVEGYLKVFLLYLALTGVYYFGMFTIYAFTAGGGEGIRNFWRNALPPSITAIATCSSAACIPVNLDAVKKMGVPGDIAETVVPLGANTHKDGSVIGGVLKIVFLYGLFGRDMNSIGAIFGIIIVSFLVGAVMGAIPGGGSIGEMLIVSLYGFPPAALPIIMIIGTIIDAPATLLNSTSNTVSSMLVARLVEGRREKAEEEKLKVVNA